MPNAHRSDTDVLVVPGLFEHRFMLFSLKRALSRAGWNPKIWDDRIAFRQIDRSIARLREEIESHEGPLHIVTHSFGDWLVRQAIDEDLQTNVGAFIGIAPVMRPSWIPTMVRAAGGDWIPEFAIIADQQKSAANIRSFGNQRRLLIWAKLDAWVLEIPSDELDGIQSVRFFATHTSVVWQPQVHRCVLEFLKHSRNQVRQDS